MFTTYTDYQQALRDEQTAHAGRQAAIDAREVACVKALEVARQVDIDAALAADPPAPPPWETQR